MFSSDSNHYYHVQNAKKVAQGLKNQHQGQQRRDVTKMAKNKGEVVEKYLNQTEREIFHQAKVKELRSFFECSERLGI